MTLYLLAQTGTQTGMPGGPVRLITQEPTAIPPPTHATIDPLWVLLGLIGVAIIGAGVLIARTVWLDVLHRRPAQAAYWLLAIRRGMLPGQVSLLSRVAGATRLQAHPVSLLCSPSARSACAAAYLRTRPSPRDAMRLTRLVQRLDRFDARAQRASVTDEGL